MSEQQRIAALRARLAAEPELDLAAAADELEAVLDAVQVQLDTPEPETRPRAQPLSEGSTEPAG